MLNYVAFAPALMGNCAFADFFESQHVSLALSVLTLSVE